MGARHFGYHGGGFHGGGDRDGRDVADHCDYTMFYDDFRDGHTPEHLRQQIETAASVKVASVISIMRTFFYHHWDPDVPKAQWWTLRPDHEDRFVRLKNALGPALASVGGFVQVEEPGVMAGQKMAEFATSARHDERHALAGRMAYVNKCIRKHVPHWTIGIFAGVELRSGHAMEFDPGACGFDVVGFNEYEAPESIYLDMFYRLAAACPAAKLLLIADAFMGPGDNAAAKRNRIEKLYELAQHPRVYAVMAWLWASEGGYQGTKDVPWLKARYREIGRAITGR